jgi:ubiquinone/menaquinone biosynthesis C-methylase UbiE
LNNNIPYFDTLFEELASGNIQVESVFGKHVHWGYWIEPKNADISFQSFSRATEQLTNQIIDYIQFEEGQQLIDVGCGFGGTLSSINEKYRNCSLIGLNIDPRQIERAQNLVQGKNGNEIQFLVGNACDLPFEKNSADCILAVESIFHFPSRTRFFNHAARVLKPGGRLILSDFVLPIWSLPLFFLSYLIYGKDLRRQYGKMKPILQGHYLKLANKSGFNLIIDSDITNNILPTYDALEKLFESQKRQSSTQSQATKYLGKLSRLGWLKYRIIVLERK